MEPAAFARPAAGWTGPTEPRPLLALGAGLRVLAPLVGYGVGGGLVHALGAGGTLLASAPFILGLTVAALLLPPLSGATGTGGCARWPTCGKGWGAFAVRCWVCWA
ncbi:MAG: hypothetical protein AB1511_11770 [Deinococcota bacterium]